MSDPAPRRSGYHDPHPGRVALLGLLVPGLGHAASGRGGLGLVAIWGALVVVVLAALAAVHAGLFPLLLLVPVIALSSMLGAHRCALAVAADGGVTLLRRWCQTLAFVLVAWATVGLGVVTVRAWIVDIVVVEFWDSEWTFLYSGNEISTEGDPAWMDHVVLVDRLSPRLGRAPRRGDRVVRQRLSPIVSARIDDTLETIIAVEGECVWARVCPGEGCTYYFCGDPRDAPRALVVPPGRVLVDHGETSWTYDSAGREWGSLPGFGTPFELDHDLPRVGDLAIVGPVLISNEEFDQGWTIAFVGERVSSLMGERRTR